MQIEKGFTDNCLECKVEIAEQTHPSDTIVAGDLAWWSRPSMFPGKKAERRLKNKRKFSRNWKKVVDKNQLRKFLSDKDVALLASGYRASE